MARILKTGKILLVSAILAVLCISAYGYAYVSSMMSYMHLHPPVDLYANDVGFQIVAFLYVKGAGLCLVAAILLFIEYGMLRWVAKRLDRCEGPAR